MNKFFSVLASAALVFSLSACGGDDSANEDSANAGDSASNAKEGGLHPGADEPIKTVKDDVPVYEVGQTAVVSTLGKVKYKITVTEVEVLEEYRGRHVSEYLSGAVDNDRFVVIHSTVENIGKVPLNPVKDAYFRVGTTDQEILIGDIVHFHDEESLDAPIEPGETVETEQYTSELLDEEKEMMAQLSYDTLGETWYQFTVNK